MKKIPNGAKRHEALTRSYLWGSVSTFHFNCTANISNHQIEIFFILKFLFDLYCINSSISFFLKKFIKVITLPQLSPLSEDHHWPLFPCYLWSAVLLSVTLNVDILTIYFGNIHSTF